MNRKYNHSGIVKNRPIQVFAGCFVVSTLGFDWFMRAPKTTTANAVMEFVTIAAICIQWSVVIYLWLRWKAM